MAITGEFYNETTKKYVTLFGNLFNEIQLETSEGRKQYVPLSYGPRQKFYEMIERRENFTVGEDGVPVNNSQNSAISLPRISFQISSITFDTKRKAGSTKRIQIRDDNTPHFRYAPTPYKIEFELSVYVKDEEDGFRIMEQIIPFFNPNLTTRARIIDGMAPIDISVFINSVNKDDNFEGSFEERRSIIWNMSFTMDAWYYGPAKESKLIKFVDIRFFEQGDPDNYSERYTARPGLTADGKPTKDEDESIEYLNINEFDNWLLIEKFEENNEEN